ncbi:ATP-binding cassette domain-containing protein, partial [Streptomyces sp. DT17]
RIAVVGSSGSGKTTLAQVMLRCLDARSGTYRIGGVDASALEGDPVRRFVGLGAPAAPSGVSSIRAHRRLGRTGASDADGRAALRRARGVAGAGG